MELTNQKPSKDPMIMSSCEIAPAHSVEDLG